MLPIACAASGTFALTSIVPQIQKKNRPVTTPEAWIKGGRILVHQDPGRRTEILFFSMQGHLSVDEDLERKRWKCR